jgi:uncharacterized membrane protein YeaQ/YmgE (transglycosylase-associated protein family)
MIVGLVIVFGAVVGLIAFNFKGSGYGLGWDMILGVSGSIISSVIMTGAYLMKGFGEADNIGLNWYSMTVGAVGALVMIFGMKLYKRASIA